MVANVFCFGNEGYSCVSYSIEIVMSVKLSTTGREGECGVQIVEIKFKYYIYNTPPPSLFFSF